MTVFIIGVMFLRRFAVIVPRSTRFFSSKDSLDVASTIAELNKEMESVFGEPPPDGLANSGNRSCMAQDAHHNSHVILVLCLKNLLFEVQGLVFLAWLFKLL
ncbi:hypothetical protein V6Z11_D08G125700 [Gossypium hirsutum]|uniref:Uncharacterized protein isoform X2 n=2 Tax=Gossypium hirsutum TaxID=3635 RepID=A0ABM3AJS1_GOSHI|nr:uncharacterized protein LOC107911986 isoform X2 [Gossypium hirsutum]